MDMCGTGVTYSLVGGSYVLDIWYAGWMGCGVPLCTAFISRLAGGM